MAKGFWPFESLAMMPGIQDPMPREQPHLSATRLAPPPKFTSTSGKYRAQHLLHQFTQLGKLQSIHDLELRGYKSDNGGRTGLFSLKGVFENGEALVNVTIVEKDGGARVLGFYLKVTRIRDGGAKIQTYFRVAG
jgi:hypothetical protein